MAGANAPLISRLVTHRFNSRIQRPNPVLGKSLAGICRLRLIIFRFESGTMSKSKVGFF
jgi:hypothetical protein